MFREVAAADLSRSYICKLESDSHPSTFVTISLAQTGSVETTSANAHSDLHINRVCLKRSLANMGSLMPCYWTPVAPFVSPEAICIGIVIVAIVLVALFTKLKKSIILSQPDTCYCCGSTLGKTVASGLSLSVQRSFLGERAVNWEQGDIFHRCFLFCVDGKRHAALLLSYKSNAGAGTMELDRK